MPIDFFPNHRNKRKLTQSTLIQNSFLNAIFFITIVLMQSLFLQVTLLKNGTKILPKFTSEHLKNKRLEDGCLAGGLSAKGSSGLVWTLWISEMTPSKAPVLKRFILEKFWCELGQWFRLIFQKSHLYFLPTFRTISKNSTLLFSFFLFWVWEISFYSCEWLFSQDDKMKENWRVNSILKFFVALRPWEISKGSRDNFFSWVNLRK